MKKQNIIKKNSEYNRIIQNIKPLKYKNFIIYLEKNENENYNFGFSVGKKIGNAVVRNKIRRQLKNILDKNKYKKGFNCIIMVKKNIVNLEFNEMNDEILNIINNLNIREDI